MIKIERTSQCESYWHNDTLYDKKHEKHIRIKVCGLTIWHRQQMFDTNLIECKIKNGVGFK